MNNKPSVVTNFFIRSEHDLDTFWQNIEHDKVGFFEMSLIYHLVSEYLYSLNKKFKAFFKIAEDELKNKLHLYKNFNLIIEYHEYQDGKSQFKIENKILISKLKKHLEKFDIDMQVYTGKKMAILTCEEQKEKCKKRVLNNIKDEHLKIKEMPDDANMCNDCNFIDFDCEMELMLDKIQTSKLSSVQFLEQAISDKDTQYAIIDMLDCLNTANDALQKIYDYNMNSYHYTVIAKEFRKFATNLAYFIEFGTLADAMRQASHFIENAIYVEQKKFILICDTLISDLNEWIKIFTGDQRVEDIHYFDDSLIATLLQLEFILHKKAA